MSDGAERAAREAEGERTMMLRAHGWARNVFASLTRMRDEPCATLGASWPVTVDVVAAGPSLDDSIHALAGPPMIAVNTALPALAARGLVPDLVVALESVDLPTHDRAAQSWAIDVTAADGWWTRAAGRGEPASWLASSMPFLRGLCRDMGAPMLLGGVSALTHAVMLAAARGARVIRVHGADLVLPARAGERVYATGCWDVRLVRDIGDDGAYELTLPEERRLAHEAAGLPPDTHGRARRVPLTDGSAGWAGAGTRTQIDWMERIADGLGSSVALHRVTGRPVAALRGWRDIAPGAGCPPTQSLPRAGHVDPRRWRSALERALRETRAQGAAAERAHRGAPAGPWTPGAAEAEYCALADTLIQPDVIRMQRDNAMSVRYKLRATRELYRRATAITCEALERALASGAT